MKNSADRNNADITFDFADLLWRFLYQWKAVLVFCVVLSLITALGKYISDTKNYKASLEASKEAAEIIKNQSADSLTSDILSSLSETDRIAVEHTLRINDWIAERNAYMENSIIMNMDPYNVRTLYVGYMISGVDENSVLSALNNAYISTFNDTEVLNKMQAVLSPESEPQYIGELISISNVNSEYFANSNHIFEDTDASTLYLAVMLPDGSDVEAVRHTISEIMTDRQDEISDIAVHSISEIFAESRTSVNNDIVTKKNEVVLSIYNLQPAFKNSVASLTPPQAEAYNKILYYRSLSGTPDLSTVETDVVKPSFSITYALIGFVLGLFIYLCVLSLADIFSRKVGSPTSAAHLIKAPMLGEVYYQPNQSRYNLFNSKIVSQLRLGKKLEAAVQIDSLSQRIVSLCTRNKIEKLSFINTAYSTKEAEYAISSLIESCSSNNILADIRTISDTDVIACNDIRNYIVVVDKNTKSSDILNVFEHLRFVGANCIGTAYISIV